MSGPNKAHFSRQRGVGRSGGAGGGGGGRAGPVLLDSNGGCDTLAPRTHGQGGCWKRLTIVRG